MIFIQCSSNFLFLFCLLLIDFIKQVLQVTNKVLLPTAHLSVSSSDQLQPVKISCNTSIWWLVTGTSWSIAAVIFWTIFLRNFWPSKERICVKYKQIHYMQCCRCTGTSWSIATVIFWTIFLRISGLKKKGYVL